jgi:hypothetical protein
MSCTTTLTAPIVVPEPIVMPGQTITPPPIQTSSPIVTGETGSRPLARSRGEADRGSPTDDQRERAAPHAAQAGRPAH